MIVFLFMYDVLTGLDSLNKFIYFFEYLCLNELCYFQPTTFLNFFLFFE